MISAGQVIKKVFDPDELSLTTTIVEDVSTDPAAHTLSADQIWQRIYDPETETIRIARIE